MAPPAKVNAPPQTLPADFFDKQGSPPETLPADFDFGTGSTAPAPQPSLLQRAANAGAGLLSGIGGGAIGMMSTGDEWAQKHLPSFLTRSDFGFGKPVDEAAFRSKYVEPHSTAERIGNAAEKATEFLIPGNAEEAGAAKLADLAPKLGKAAKPAARLLTSAAGAGLVNKAQGGGLGEGALLGAGGEAIGAAGKAAAPRIVEWAQGIRPTPGAKTGKAILNETSALFPSGVRRSAQKVLDRLNPEMEGLVDRASVRPRIQPRGLLMPPPQEIPLGKFEPDVKGELIPAARLPQTNITGMGTDLSSVGTMGRIRGVPGRNVEQLGSEATTIPARLQREAYVTSGTHEAADLPRSGPGVLLRRPEMPAAAPLIPAMEPNPSVSLLPARKVAAANVEKAFGRNEPKMYKGANRLARLVNEDLEGNPLPENVTPRQALELRRGVDTALPPGSFHPESTNAFKGYRTPLRDALNEGIGEAVPGYRPLASRISALIPATKMPKHAFGHLWGPGTGALLGGYYGGRGSMRNDGDAADVLSGILKGATEGAAAGTFAPAILNLGARGMASPIIPKLLTGTSAQLTPRKAAKP